MNKLKEIVNKSGKNIKVIVNELGIPKASLYRYMSGERELKETEIRKICSYFQVTSDYLLNIDEVK